MQRPTNPVWIHRFAVVTVLAVLALIGIGGLVTSKGAGMAVPDWPTTYGYNMFLFPISQWQGGIFYEHSHRLVASLVGLLTVILAVALWMGDSRRWLRWFGMAAVLLVVTQGLLGGLRVTLYKDQIGIVHAALAQLFLCCVATIAIVTSRWWHHYHFTPAQSRAAAILRPWFILTTVAVFVQLLLGATMRHEHAGLAVPDFPLAYGRVWPATDTVALDKLNESRIDQRDFKPITATHIYVHMAHRLGALIILAAVTACWWKMRRHPDAPHFGRVWANIWFAGVVMQAVLGAVTIWSNKAADIATLHVILGACLLGLGAAQCLALSRLACVIDQSAKSDKSTNVVKSRIESHVAAA